jgi:hypothetical protein
MNGKNIFGYVKVDIFRKSSKKSWKNNICLFWLKHLKKIVKYDFTNKNLNF